MTVIAGLVLREALRRRLLLAVGLLTLASIALTAWGFARIPYLDGDTPMPPDQVRLIAAYLTIMVAFTFSFVLALAGVFVASPAISGELETGIALTVLARPLSRDAYVLGKWLGLAGLLLAYTVASIAIELVVIRITTGYTPPSPVVAFAYLYVEGLVLLTLALALSARLSGMVGGVVALIAFGIAWLGGIVAGVGQAFDNAALAQVGNATKVLLPTDGLWRGAAFALEPSAIVAALGPERSLFTLANPFFTPTPPPAAFVAWAGAWIVLVLGWTVWTFRRREI